MSMTAKDKEQLYAFLKSLFVTDPTLQLVKRLQQPGVLDGLRQIGISLTEKDVTDEALPQIKEDYTQLFIGPQKHISLNESVYREQTPQFWGEATVRSQRLIKELGLTLNENWHLMPDHITVEFEILQKLAERETEAVKENDQETLVKCQKYASKFFLDHISKWVPKVCQQMVQQASTRFYKEMGLFIQNFVSSQEQEMIKENL